MRLFTVAGRRLAYANSQQRQCEATAQRAPSSYCCAGIHPATTLPIVLEVGTNPPALLDAPLHLEWRYERVRGEEYDAFIEQFVTAVEKVFPNVLLQWEDFAKDDTRRILDRYRDRILSFNDDIQGAVAITLAGWLAAVQR